MIEEALYLYAKNCVEKFQDYTSSVEAIYQTKISHLPMAGSGVVIKIEDGPLNTGRKANAEETAVYFTLSDGQNAIPCLVHNGKSTTMPGSMDSMVLTTTLSLLTESMRKGQQVIVFGQFQIHPQGKEKVFVCEQVLESVESNVSQLTAKQVEGFKSLCKRYGKTPLQVMISDDTLWRYVYAHDPIKLAVMLNCLSPFSKQDMMHMAVITSMGEGKDHLIENVIQPLVPCGVASTGKLCTIPGLFGAMSGEDLNSIELGLIGKMNNERMAVSEFQTWGSDVFGELMNMLANGSYTMQKGQVDLEREACLNVSFWGNPEKEYEEKMDKIRMLDVFGEYTYQMISRMTLMFTQMTLTDEGADEYVENKILDAMSGSLDTPESKERLHIWRSFFREYLRYVSRMQPDINKSRELIRNQFQTQIKETQMFTDVFLKRSKKENRKFQQFINLCKGFARLQGDEVVDLNHISMATELFMVALETVVQNVPLNMDLLANDPKMRTLVQAVKTLVGDGYPDRGELELRLRQNHVSFRKEQIDTLFAEEYLIQLEDGEVILDGSKFE
jgi:DNA replicative helicase MCM subunit Mcm2 (Cdc46/Mcm family)